MSASFRIRPMGAEDLPRITEWARREGFCPGVGDVGIMRHADEGGVWVGCLGDEPIGCVLGVRYSASYGFIGLFLVRQEHRGHGYGVALWRRALAHLEPVSCIGLEAAPERVADYASWGFQPHQETLRWRLPAAPRPHCMSGELPAGYRVVPVDSVPLAVVQAYDDRHEATPRPLFLREWLGVGSVPVVLDEVGCCRGFAALRSCLLPEPGERGWRLGPWLADGPGLAGALLDRLIGSRDGVVLVDAPEANPRAHRLLEQRGFQPVGQTIRMYRGTPPALPVQDVYGLACLELG